MSSLFVIVAIGEFGPIAAISLLLGAQGAFSSLVVLAAFGPDVVLGAFFAGMITRRSVGLGTGERLGTEIDRLAFGLFVPLLFVVSGMLRRRASDGGGTAHERLTSRPVRPSCRGSPGCRRRSSGG